MLLAYWISFVKSLVLGGFVTFDVICQFSPLKARSRLLCFYTCTVAEYCKRHKSIIVIMLFTALRKIHTIVPTRLQFGIDQGVEVNKF